MTIDEVTALLSYAAKRQADAQRLLDTYSGCPSPELRSELAFFGRVAELAEAWLDREDHDDVTDETLAELRFTPAPGAEDGTVILDLPEERALVYSGGALSIVDGGMEVDLVRHAPAGVVRTLVQELQK
jgi:hypothetical protein